MRVIACLMGVAGSLLIASQGWAADPAPIFLDQGPAWTETSRAEFYSQDQGSRMMPLAWLRALQQPNGQPFLADNLTRYGYLPNPLNSNGLPVGFSASGPTGAQTVGMTCAACHTRQIAVGDKTYRIDGGPAIVDFQSFLADLDTAIGQVVAGDQAFAPFAAAVLRPATAAPDDVAALRRDVDAWYLRYHALIKVALPTSSPWGPARLDAVGMIFNRLAGLDLGPPPSLLIPDNIKPADAPARYPFLWNAPVQDKTQWPTFADNGNEVLGLARNLGEVFGVFGVFQPKPEGLLVNFLNNGSANFDGLDRLEKLIRQIAPPKWPWDTDQDLVAQGKLIYARPMAQGGCQECHAVAPDIPPGKVRFPLMQTWSTPAQNVGTDTRVKPTDQAFNVLATSVVGSIAEHVLRLGGTPRASALIASIRGPQIQAAPGAPRVSLARLPPALRDLEGAFHQPAPPEKRLEFHIQGALVPRPVAAASPLPAKGTYEARVLQGIWAVAPYLHNGSVPSLAELLKPSSARVAQFKVGSNYDTQNVGLAAEQTQFNASIVTTDCSNLNSGNSRCGHDYGTQLSDQEKKALLEYLKTL